MPVDYSKYPPDWKAISLRIRERSGGRCECEGECGLHPDHRCVEMNGEPALWAKGRIILTVAHYPDHDPQNVADDNLKAMCQRCHLRCDADHHAENAKRTRVAKFYATQEGIGI